MEIKRKLGIENWSFLIRSHAQMRIKAIFLSVGQIDDTTT